MVQTFVLVDVQIFRYAVVLAHRFIVGPYLRPRSTPESATKRDQYVVVEGKSRNFESPGKWFIIIIFIY